MKKTLLIGIAIAISSLCNAQKVEYEQAQTRIIEPMAEVLVRPMAAEIKMLSTELKVYPASWQYKENKITDVVNSWYDLENAKANAAFNAAVSDGADVIIGATFYIRNHIDEKGKPTDYGVDVIVRGYPAKYVNWHQLGDPKYGDEAKWMDRLINAQQVRGYKGEDAAKAIGNQVKTK